MNLEKPENELMNDFLRGVKNIAESLAAIQSAISDMDLIQYTLNALDSDYDGFVDSPNHMPGMLTFDDVRNKLIVHEQLSQAVNATTSQARASNRGQGKSNRNNHDRHNGNSNKGKTNSNKYTSQSNFSNKGVPTGNEMFDRVLGSSPNEVTRGMAEFPSSLASLSLRQNKKHWWWLMRGNHATRIAVDLVIEGDRFSRRISELCNGLVAAESHPFGANKEAPSNRTASGVQAAFRSLEQGYNLQSELRYVHHWAKKPWLTFWISLNGITTLQGNLTKSPVREVSFTIDLSPQNASLSMEMKRTPAIGPTVVDRAMEHLEQLIPRHEIANSHHPQQAFLFADQITLTDTFRFRSKTMMSDQGRKMPVKLLPGPSAHVNVSSSLEQNQTTGVKGRWSLGARLLHKGNTENLFKRVFSLSEGEQLLKAFCSCLSTTAGPVAGLLFISTEKLAFCSDKSVVKLTSPTGESVRFRYKVVIPLRKIQRVSQSQNARKTLQK
ncbi:hypothetical protein Cgig2_026778 [Carnegiea gigantea]|uniref:GRAM domain-containing protein n=1 Tax=Carnegiea gigantea TaxID=171969 RepID=A0A9Q1GLR3_9CARY|nr:hypothetical protein Cgig2_026778 [Carnegiea gigantea]